MKTYRIDLAYDGTDFHGYAKQPQVRTVQGELETALFKMTGEVETEVAGRTDRGVHATGQVVSFRSDTDLSTEVMCRSLNRQLAPELGISSVATVPDSFSARFSATGRTYRYLLLNREFGDPFLARTSYHFKAHLDVDLMNEGVSYLVGLHDFAAFCRRAPNRSSERRLDAAVWSRLGDGLLAFDVSASSFCHQMVRSLVALCVEVGRGRVSPKQGFEILKSTDRRQAKGASPARGLTLTAVKYD